MKTAEKAISRTTRAAATTRRAASQRRSRRTLGPITALCAVGWTFALSSSAGRKKKEINPAKVMPTAVNSPSCWIGLTSATSSDRKPAAVEIVVRIIGTPIWRSVDVTRSRGSSVRATSSWKWVTKCSPSAEPITITKIGTRIVRRSTWMPRPKITPKVQIDPRSAGRIAKIASFRSPMVRKKVPSSRITTQGGIASRNQLIMPSTLAKMTGLPDSTRSKSPPPPASFQEIRLRARSKPSPSGSTITIVDRRSSLTSRSAIGLDSSPRCTAMAGSSSRLAAVIGPPVIGWVSGTTEATPTTPSIPLSSAVSLSRSANTAPLPNAEPSGAVTRTLIGSPVSYLSWSAAKVRPASVPSRTADARSALKDIRKNIASETSVSSAASAITRLPC